MSDAMMADFSRMADSMTYEEVISVISLLLERLKRPFAQISPSQPAFIEEMFAIADKEPELHKSEGREANRDLQKLKNYWGKIDLDIDLDALRERYDPR
ncbi:MAG: hypothetical protein ILP18_09150 [Treponema sp.]|nr:hypothetical protein [Treponema sp.]